MVDTVQFITENFNRYDPASLESYLSIGGFESVKKALTLTPSEIIAIIKKGQIRGRGGAEYDAARKWSQAADVKGANKVVICNADEGEPCTFKDRTILEKDPFRLIEGMIISAYTVGAQNGYLYIREEYRHLQATINNCIRQCYGNGFLGNNIMNSSFNFDLHVYTGAGAYVCGEGSTLIESIEGKSGRPRIKPPYIKQCGLFQLPTCVNNVETLAAASALVLHGADQYIKNGTKESPGTKIICLAGNVKNPGSFEIPFGLTLREIIYELGGGIYNDNKLQFFQLGGASGRIGSADLVDTPYTYEDLKRVNLSVGSGGILVVDERTPILDFVNTIQVFFSHESCGKCTPCREGNRQISKIIKRFVNGNQRETDLETAKRFADIMRNCSFCGLGETAQSVFFSALEQYPEAFGM